MISSPMRSDRILTADSKRHALADKARFHKDFMALTLQAGYENFLVGELPSGAGAKLSQAAKLTSLQPFMLNACSTPASDRSTAASGRVPTEMPELPNL